MGKIFEEYGGMIVTVIAVIALVAIVAALVNGPIGLEFDALFDSFFDDAQDATNATQAATTAAGLIRRIPGLFI